jgi:glycosyltransferase involved in cell wall biosynthesis
LTTAARLTDDSSDRLLLPRLLISDSSVCGTEQDFHAGKSSLLLARSAWHTKNGRGRAKTDGRLPQERIRISFVIDAIHAWEGGTEQQIGKLLAALDRRYFEPELYFLRPSLNLTAEDFPCPVFLANRRREVRWYRLTTLTRLVRLFTDRHPQIVQTFFRDGTYYGILAAKIAGVPITVASLRNASHWKRGIDRLVFKAMAHIADSWQCNSRSVSEVLTRQDGVAPESIEILPNALDLERFSPVTPQERIAARKELGLPPIVPVFVSVANANPIKDLATLIEAARRVELNLPMAQFLLVGEGPLRQPLELEVNRLGLGHVVRFLGRQPEVRRCLAAADVGVLTSRSEGSSNAVLEYMAMGLPAVLSDIPGNRDLVDQVFFEPGNSADLAAKILGLWNNPGLREQMRKEYHHRAEEYSSEAFVRRAQSYYESLAASFL